MPKIHFSFMRSSQFSLGEGHINKFCSDSQSCVTLCNLMDYSLPDSSVHGIFRQELRSGLPFPPLEDLPDQGTEPTSLISPSLAGGIFTTSSTWEAPISKLCECN